MKTRNYFLIYLLFITVHLFPQTGVTIEDSLLSNGIYRSYRIYVPTIYNGTKAVPLVLNFHGFTSSAAQQDFYTNFKNIADTANFIVVHPQGLPISALGTTGLGWTNFDPITTPNKDIQFVIDLLDLLETQYNINTNRVYSTGMSNGGFMSYDLACFLSNRITAIASVTGTMNIQHFIACNPNKPIPVMQIHGTSDKTVDYNGTIVNMNIDTLVKKFVKHNGCITTPTFTQIPDNVNIVDNCTAEHYVYSGGQNNSSVELYKIIGGDHSWPGASVNINTTNMDFDATKEIWRFFSQYNLPAEIKHFENNKTSFTLYPNPTTGLFKIKFDNLNSTTIQINVSNTIGKEMYNFSTNTPNKNEFEHIINLENFPAGIYLLNVLTNHSVESTKLIIY